VELRTSQHTTEDGALQRGEDFIRAFNLGFEVDDAIALLRMDDIYSKHRRSCWGLCFANTVTVETFEIKDVRQVMGKDAQSRASTYSFAL
jgi:RNA-binding protein PNO1